MPAGGAVLRCRMTGFAGILPIAGGGLRRGHRTCRKRMAGLSCRGVVFAFGSLYVRMQKGIAHELRSL